MYEILEYNELDKSGLNDKINKTISKIKENGFKSAQVKKLKGTDYYRAKLDDSNRLIFKISSYKNKPYLLLLETVRNHNYSRSRFLNGVTEKKFEEEKWEEIDSSNHTEEPTLKFVNVSQQNFHYLDKPISFDAFQNELYFSFLPLIVIGSAGSGKTAIMLEKIKQLEGRILYVTLSKFLAESARNLYFSQSYHNEKQEINFFSYEELLETVQIPIGKECKYDTFKKWYIKQKSDFSQKLSRKIFEEFKGVLTGSSFEKPHLSREDYLGLGVKQSIFLGDERNALYSLFERYLNYLKQENLFDINIESFHISNKVSPNYDYICVDEIQDLTTIQVVFILKFLQNKKNFLFCGDSNQIVHPNFFSWSKIKSLFFEQDFIPNDLIKILQNNYRNAISINNLANNILKIKQKRFGSIDKESNYLVRSDSVEMGIVDYYKDSQSIRKDLNEKTCRSAKYAIVTLNEEQKNSAKLIFNTPLIFTVYEAKGLEYPNVIIFNMVSDAQSEFREICFDVEKHDIDSENLQYSRAKDKSDKSIEGLKFYINSLYVAVTRATEGIYWIESIVNQPLLQLLNFGEGKKGIVLKEEQSSLDEWQKEASKLELQGKQEQADEIRKKILKQIPVPWPIRTIEDVKKFLPKDVKQLTYDKKAQRFLFEMAYAYNWKFIIHTLIESKYALASNKSASKEYMHDKFYSLVKFEKLKEIKELVFKHGVEFENQLGERLLSISTKLEEPEILKELLACGANKEIYDLSGRTPFGTLLYSYFFKKLNRLEKFYEIFNLLLPSSISLKYKNRLIKIDQKSPEFLFVQILIALLPSFVFKSTLDIKQSFINAELLSHFSSAFPDFVFPEWRKKRAYVSSILSKNEVQKENLSGKNYHESKKLFLRVRLGHYVLNPALEVLCGNEWKSILNLFPYEVFLLNLDLHHAKHFHNFLHEKKLKINSEPL